MLRKQPVIIKPSRKIEVKRLGLATGQAVVVRRKRRIQIEVKYHESDD